MSTLNTPTSTVTSIRADGRPMAAVTEEPYTPPAKAVANARPQHGPGGRHGMARSGEKAINFGPSLRRLLAQLRPDRFKVILVIVMGALGVTFNVLTPKILGQATNIIFEGVVGRQMGTQFAGMTKQQVIDILRTHGQQNLADMLASMNVVPGQGIDFTRLGHVLLLMVGLLVAAMVLNFLQGFVLTRVVQRLVYRMRAQVSDKLDRLPLSFFDRQPRGELLSRVTNDVDNIQQTLQQTLSQLLNAIMMMIGVLIMMVPISWVLTLITLVLIPVSGVIATLIGRRSQKRFAKVWESTGDLSGQVEEAFTGHALVKVFGRQREVMERFNTTNTTLFKAAFGAQFISMIIMPLVVFIGNVNYVVVAVLGGLWVAQGTMSLGSVQAFIQYSRQFSQPIGQVASMANLLQSGVASAERVFEVLDAPEQIPDLDGRLREPMEGHVTFERVNFRYEPDTPLIDDLSLEAKPGQQIAIVGPTGAGKTTLVNLLERFYEIQAGRISLDGVDITTVPRADLRRSMGMVLQDTWLFGGTIRENIAYGKPDATQEEILTAARSAYVDHFVHALPEGYDTVIDEEGSNISAGQKQLLTIARAFIADPAILILDEATSSVDTRTELLVQHAMARLRQGRTSFVIAHRLSTIRDADLILVMEHGDIVEQGTHQELLDAKGAYFDLYQSQFSGAVEEEELQPASLGRAVGGA